MLAAYCPCTPTVSIVGLQPLFQLFSTVYYAMSACSERKRSAGSKQGRPSNKAVAALQRKAEPAENWQGFKTKGSKKTVAAAITKSTGNGPAGG